MTSTHRQLADATKRRTQALDRMIDAFIEICHCDSRIDVLLDRLAEQQAAEQPGRMT